MSFIVYGFLVCVTRLGCSKETFPSTCKASLHIVICFEEFECAAMGDLLSAHDCTFNDGTYVNSGVQQLILNVQCAI